MTAQHNEALMRRFVELFNERDPEGLDEIVAAGYAEHSPDSPSGPDGLKRFFTQTYAGFPNARAAVEDVVAEEDKVGGRVTIVGTHEGGFLGLAPTGRRVSIRSIDIFRVEGGRLAGHWEAVDRSGLLRQLGTDPGTA